MANILVCDDERSICEMLDISLRREGHKVETVQSGQAAKNKIDGPLYDVIITDIKMPNIDGIEVLRHAHRVSPDSAVILITAVDDYEAAVEAARPGSSFADMARAAERVLEQAGYAGCVKYGLGHGVGLQIHEAPGISASAAGTLLAGSAVTVEPGVYLPDHGGVRIEDTLVVGDNNALGTGAFGACTTTR